MPVPRGGCKSPSARSCLVFFLLPLADVECEVGNNFRDRKAIHEAPFCLLGVLGGYFVVCL